MLERNDSTISVIMNYPEHTFEDHLTKYELDHIHNSNRTSFRWMYKNLLAHYMKSYTLIESENNGAKLRIQERIIQTTVNYSRNEEIRDTTIHVEEREWRRFNEQIESTCLWTMRVDYEGEYLDGEQILVEGRRPDTSICTKKAYHMILRMRGDDQDIVKINELFWRFEPLELREFE